MFSKQNTKWREPVNDLQEKIITAQRLLAVLLLVQKHSPRFLFKQWDLLRGFWLCGFSSLAFEKWVKDENLGCRPVQQSLTWQKPASVLGQKVWVMAEFKFVIVECHLICLNFADGHFRERSELYATHCCCWAPSIKKANLFRSCFRLNTYLNITLHCLYIILKYLFIFSDKRG